MVGKLINHSECSECGKDLRVHTNSPIISMYRPQALGPTTLSIQGNQCSNECYMIALKKRHEIARGLDKNNK